MTDTFKNNWKQLLKDIPLQNPMYVRLPRKRVITNSVILLHIKVNQLWKKKYLISLIFQI